ncbi:hypothetical protein C1Y35_05270 [Pseudomonas sp. GW456-L14]|nr:hypothetical protein C1Y35_05270 [Pseudomonas sp. GW456-L14]PMY58760.1 hypothetical protein C1Y34_03275 [Pseudomonas sp. GW456-L12]
MASNTDSKKALDDDAAYVGLHRKLESISDEAGRLLKETSALSEKFVLGHGVSIEALEAKVAETLKEWQSSMSCAWGQGALGSRKKLYAGSLGSPDRYFCWQIRKSPLSGRALTRLQGEAICQRSLGANHHRLHAMATFVSKA